MDHPSQQIRQITKLLVAHERQRTADPADGTLAAIRAIETLRPQLVNLMGNGGFSALLLRTIALAKADVPWLHGAQVDANGFVQGLEDVREQLVPTEFIRGTGILVAHLIGLMVIFIGEKITMRLVQEAWPELLLGNVVFGDSDEKAR